MSGYSIQVRGENRICLGSSNLSLVFLKVNHFLDAATVSFGNEPLPASEKLEIIIKKLFLLLSSTF